MWKKVPDPNNPKVLIDATPIEIVGGNTQAFVEASLADGARVTINLQITGISRLEGRRDQNGNPVYDVAASAQITVTPKAVIQQ